MAGHSPGLAIIGQYPINPKGRLVDDGWSESIRLILLYKKVSQLGFLVAADTAVRESLSLPLQILSRIKVGCSSGEDLD